MGSSFLDLLFPESCLLCRSSLADGEVSLCAGCAREEAAAPVTRCPGCGKSSVADSLTFCPPCRGKYRRDGLVAGLLFEGVTRDLIHSFKYRADFRAGRHFVGAMARQLLEEPSAGIGIIVPVPLHRARLRRRGFNQAAYLARGLSRETGLPLAARGLVRKKRTDSLPGLVRTARFHELKGAFCAPRPRGLAGRRVLLVDDVVTTGATVEECCRTLKEAGAEGVVAIAAARA